MTQGRVRAHVSGVVDSLVLRVMQQIFIASHRRGVKQTGGVQGLGGSWRELAETAAENPRAIFPDPVPPEEVVSKRRKRLKGGWIEDLRFPSAYAPERRTAKKLLREYPTNVTGHARHFRHAQDRDGDGGRRPALIWLHGWGMGSYGLETRVFQPMSFFKLGLDVYLYVQPYHAARMPEGVRFAGTMHPTTHITRTNEAFLQTTWEVRALAARHRQLTGGPCGVMGWSLGGYVAAMLASLAPELAFAVPMLPIADVPALLWSWGEGTKDRAEAEAVGVTFDEFCEAMAVHAPLAHRLAIPKDRVLMIGGKSDRIIPPIHTQTLWEHWGRPRIHWFLGSHIVHFGRQGYMEQVRDFLRSLGLIDS